MKKQFVPFGVWGRPRNAHANMDSVCFVVDQDSFLMLTRHGGKEWDNWLESRIDLDAALNDIGPITWDRMGIRNGDLIIEDTDATPQRFLLVKLIDCVLKHAGAQSELTLFRSQGYGLTINAWDRLLDESDVIAVDTNQFVDVARGTAEWFYHLDAQLGVVPFGIHDSSAMYVRADQQLARAVRSAFSQVSTHRRLSSS